MADQKVLPKGLRFFEPHQAAPDFVIASLVITPNELVQFCKDNAALLSEYNGNKQLKLQVLRSQEGKIYSVVDTYKKGDAKPAKTAKPASPAEITEPADDLPF